MVFYQTESSEKESQHQRTKKLNFGLEPSVKFVSHISGLVSKRKNGGQIFFRENDQTGGGPRGVW